MHVSHYMPPPELNARLQARKPAAEGEKTRAYADIASDPDGGRGRGGKQQRPDKNESDPPLPTTSGLLRPKARPLKGNRPGPFMVVTSVTEFWTELVMAERPAEEAKPSAPPPSGPSLLDLFADAVK